MHRSSKVKTDVWSRHILYSSWEGEISFGARHDFCVPTWSRRYFVQSLTKPNSSKSKNRIQKEVGVCMCHIAVEKVGNQGMDAVLAETVYLKISLQTMGAVGWKIWQTCQLFMWTSDTWKSWGQDFTCNLHVQSCSAHGRQEWGSPGMGQV